MRNFLQNSFHKVKEAVSSKTAGLRNLISGTANHFKSQYDKVTTVIRDASTTPTMIPYYPPAPLTPAAAPVQTPVKAAPVVTPEWTPGDETYDRILTLQEDIKIARKNALENRHSEEGAIAAFRCKLLQQELRTHLMPRLGLTETMTRDDVERQLQKNYREVTPAEKHRFSVMNSALEVKTSKSMWVHHDVTFALGNSLDFYRACEHLVRQDTLPMIDLDEMMDLLGYTYIKSIEDFGTQRRPLLDLVLKQHNILPGSKGIYRLDSAQLTFVSQREGATA